MHRKHTTAKDGMQSARSVSHSGKTLRRYLSIRPVAVVAAAAAALLTTGLVAGPLASISGAAPTSHALTTSGLGYTPLASPIRLADTRVGATDPLTYAGKTLAEGTSLTVDVPSADVPATASAVVVNITAITPTNGGFLTVYPGGTTLPLAANVTFTTGQTVGNEVTVGLGSDSVTGSTQSFTVYDGPATGGSTVDFTADVMGYYAPQTATSGDAYVGLTPARIYDSRTGSGLTGAGTTLSSGGSATVTVANVGGVPATASAVALNVAITNPTASSFITAYPAGTTQPGTANQNFLAGETLSSQVVAKVGTGGAVTIANHAGSVDIVVDVDGYFTAAGATGSLLTVLPSPVRLTDTRSSGNVLNGSGGVVGGGAATAVVQGAGATAGVLSLADITTVGDGNFLTAYPTGGATPLAATVNYVPGDTYNIVENAAYATTGTGQSVSVLNGPANAAPANIVVDEDGFFSPTTTPPSSSFTIVATPSPATINVLNGSVGLDTSTVTVTVTGVSGSPVAADETHLTLVPSLSVAGVGGSCGTLLPSPFNPTGGTGQFVYTYDASAIPGSCTITATEANQAAVTTTTITQLPVTNLVSVVAAPSHITSNGSSTTPVTVTVTSPLGAPVVGDPITFVLTPEPGGTCGTLPLGPSPTGPGGVLTESYMSSVNTPSNFCQIVATEGLTLNFGGTTIDQTSAVSTVNSVTVNPFPASVEVQPAPAPDDLSVITTTVLGAGPTGIVGDPVEFVLTPSLSVGAASSCGILTGVTAGAIAGTFFGTTGGGGALAAGYTASFIPGTCTITATEGNNTVVGTSVITQLPITNIVVVSAAPPVLTGNGITTSIITATVTSPTGAPLPGDSVAFTAAINGVGAVALPGSPVITNAAGQAIITYTSDTTSEFVTITATESGTGNFGLKTLDLTST